MLTHRHMEIDLRRRDIFVPQKLLDPPQIHASLQQMRRKRMPQGINTLLINSAWLESGIGSIRFLIVKFR